MAVFEKHSYDKIVII